MPERRYPVFSNPTPPCIGRKAQLDRLVSSLTKPIPDHVQVVGPRFAGKTVLLTNLIAQLEKQSSPYTAIFFWDLAHQNLDDDSHFLRVFGEHLAQALRARHPDYANHLSSLSNLASAEIAEVLEALKGDGGKVLAVLDGFDKAVANGRLTRNLWDQLRELSIKPSLRLVTASRKRLSELIRDPNAETSPFWNIFDPTPVRVGCFDERDIEAVLAVVPELTLSAGGQSELLNATNAAPLLTVEVLNALLDNGEQGEISAEVMRNKCQTAYAALRDRLSLLWADCPPTAQDLFRLVRAEGAILRSEVSWADAEMLIERGFLQLSGNKLQRANRLLGNLLDETPNESSSLARLFSSASAYQANLRTVFEHRIVQIDRLDPTLARYLRHGIDDIPDHPDVFLTHIRGLVDKVFDLIWKAEIPDKRIPSAWMAIWRRNEERRIEDWETTFPQGVHRLRLLNLITGTDKSTPCAHLITKETYVLMNAVHAFGDFGQHQEGTVVDVGTGYAALHLCIELAAAITRELQSR
ncbi:MAG: hypothetical protein V4451_02230 [Pseudomonadota bacterium]